MPLNSYVFLLLLNPIRVNNIEHFIKNWISNYLMLRKEHILVFHIALLRACPLKFFCLSNLDERCNLLFGNIRSSCLKLNFELFNAKRKAYYGFSSQPTLHMSIKSFWALQSRWEVQPSHLFCSYFFGKPGQHLSSCLISYASQ